MLVLLTKAEEEAPAYWVLVLMPVIFPWTSICVAIMSVSVRMTVRKGLFGEAT